MHDLWHNFLLAVGVLLSCASLSGALGHYRQLKHNGGLAMERRVWLRHWLQVRLMIFVFGLVLAGAQVAHLYRLHVKALYGWGP